MTDLTDYDRVIVEAAERYVAPQHEQYIEIGYQHLVNAVQAKRDAQRPRCGFWTGMEFCDNSARQAFRLNDNNPENYRCDEHRIDVREL